MKKRKSASAKTTKAIAVNTIPPQAQKRDKAYRILYQMEPLPATFTLIGLLGFIITTVFTISGRIDQSWGFAFDLVFVLMFIASMASISPKFSGWT